MSAILFSTAIFNFDKIRFYCTTNKRYRLLYLNTLIDIVIRALVSSNILLFVYASYSFMCNVFLRFPSNFF